ncbi:MAG: hypothetical protein RIC38_02640, partial [Chromatocurvus sp.]
MIWALLHSVPGTSGYRRPRGQGTSGWQRRAVALAALLLVLSSASSRADCGCLWRGSFVDVHPDTDLVVAAAVEAGRGNAIDIGV